jgi:hypothetical protein
MTAHTEQERRVSNTKKLLAHLKAHGRATNAELNRIAGFRFSARVLELRKEGHRITTHRVRDGVFLYTYHGHPDDNPVEQLTMFGE